MLLFEDNVVEADDEVDEDVAGEAVSESACALVVMVSPGLLLCEEDGSVACTWSFDVVLEAPVASVPAVAEEVSGAPVVVASATDVVCPFSEVVFVVVSAAAGSVDLVVAAADEVVSSCTVVVVGVLVVVLSLSLPPPPPPPLL